MQKKWLIYFFLFLTFLIYLAPASLIERFLPEKAPLHYEQINGRLWQGKIAGLKLPGIQLGDITYDLSILDLVSGALGGKLQLTKGDIEGELVVTWYAQNHIQWQDANLSAPALIAEAYLPVRGIQLAGQLETESFSGELINNRPIFLQGITQWKNAGLNWQGQTWQLGDIKIKWNSSEKDKQIHGELISNDNQLGLRGTITLNDKGELLFIGSIATTAEKPIYDTLAIFADGKPAAGRLPLKFKRKVF